MKILQLFDSEQHLPHQPWALLEIDIKNSFNEALRQAAFDVIAGKASREYDSGKVKPGHAILGCPVGFLRLLARDARHSQHS